jgi:hypothetical protein
MSWIEKNKYLYGFNWLCAMEVSIRLANWSIAHSLIKDLFISNKEQKKIFLKSIGEHFKFIYDNLEATIKTPLGNHYLSDIAGLMYAILFYPLLLNSEKVKLNLINELIEQINKQILDDGVSFENSIGYHRYVTEVFFYSGLICNKFNINLGNGYWSKLENMIDFILHYVKPDGNAPLFGDSDDGFWHIIDNNQNININDHRYLLTLAGFYFKRIDFIKGGISITDNITTLCKYFNIDIIYPDTNNSAIMSKSFNSGGVYIMRDKDIYLGIITKNNLGKSTQFHKHNDIFSFELNVNKKNIIVDSGTYCYTSDSNMRDEFRKTKSHNTLIVDNSEQEDLEKKGFFALPNICNYKLIKWEEGINTDVFKGELEKIINNNKIKHYRTFKLDKTNKSVYITDMVEGKGVHKLDWYFHLHPDIKIKTLKNKYGLFIDDINLMFSFNEILKCIIEEGYYSNKFGAKRNNSVIHFQTKSKLPFEVEFVLDTLSKK